MYRYLEKVSGEDEEMVEYQRGQLIRSEAATILDAFISTTSAEVSGSSHSVSACVETDMLGGNITSNLYCAFYCPH